MEGRGDMCPIITSFLLSGSHPFSVRCMHSLCPAHKAHSNFCALLFPAIRSRAYLQVSMNPEQQEMIQEKEGITLLIWGYPWFTY
jgi:hypothetical protein